MSSDNFNYIAKSGRVYLNLSCSAWEGLDEPLTEQDLIDGGAKHTGWATIEDAFAEYAEYGPLAEDPLSINLESEDVSLKVAPPTLEGDLHPEPLHRACDERIARLEVEIERLQRQRDAWRNRAWIACGHDE